MEAIDPLITFVVNGDSAMCDNDHPRVYLHVPRTTTITCPYCSNKFKRTL